MAKLMNFICISIIFKITTLTTFKIDKEHIDNLKKFSHFEICDYEEHPFKDWTFDELKSLTSSHSYYKEINNKLFDNSFQFLEGEEREHDQEDQLELPRNYDIRQVYPECIQHIRHQRKCNSCWAFVATQMLSYKLCIGSKGQVKVILSPQELISCDLASNGCEDSNSIKSWYYMMSEGIVTEECLPYTSMNGVRGECPFTAAKTCKSGVYKKYKAKSKKILKSANAAKKAICQSGPIHALVDVYGDFLSYKNGVYKMTSGYDLLGCHSVMIIGWGYDSDDDMYWIGVNSWGTKWGDGGYFNIDSRHCQIENAMWTGTANLDEI
jgi:cathepsin B